MITFIMPGYSARNKTWAEDAAKSLKIEGQIRPIFWDHWDDESQKFNPKEKAELIARHAKGDSVNIIAKSIGTLVAAYVVERIPMQIEKIILCGIPPKDLGESGIKLVRNIPSQKTVIFQNDQDPLGGSQDIKKLFPNFKLIEKSGNTHDYPYFSDFNEFLS